MKKKPIGDTVFETVNLLLLILITIIILYPVLYIVFASFSDPILLRQNHGFLYKPLGFTTKGYEIAFNDPGIVTGYINTIFYLVVGVAINMVTTVVMAFVLSRRDLYWRKAIMLMITITMFFGGGLIPFYLLVRGMGMADSWLALIIPYAVNTWNIIMLRTGFQGMPAELEEAALIDGAGPIRILWSVLIPLSKAMLAVILLYNVVGSWNSWFPAMIFLTKRETFPLQLIIRELLVVNDMSNMQQNSNVSSLFSDSSSYKELVKYALIVISSFPIMLFYPFVQKHFVKGVMVGSLKG